MGERVSVLDDATAEHWATVEANTGLVWFFVNRMRIPETRRDDAFQDGCLGLLRAAMLFDAGHGTTFSTYAATMVRSYIQKGRLAAEGVNYRRSFARGEVYVPPTSLDTQVAGGDADLAELVLVDDRDPADQVAWDEAMARLERACRDDLDRDLLALMRAGAVERGDAHTHGTVRRLADRHGRSIQTVRTRRDRLTHLAGAQLQAA